MGIRWNVVDYRIENIPYHPERRIKFEVEPNLLISGGYPTSSLVPKLMDDLRKKFDTQPTQEGYNIYFSAVDELATRPKINKVIFNNPATVIMWDDGTKTVVKCQNGEPFDAEKGFVMAYLKKLLGNDNTFNKEISKWVVVEDAPDESDNKPLTMDELMKMDGQKVWCSSLWDVCRETFYDDCESGWHTVDVKELKLYDRNECYYTMDSMDTEFGYRAYRNPPKK